MKDLVDLRLPGHADAKLQLDGHALCIADTENVDNESVTAAVGLATVLHEWCPDALTAFLDLDAWFSFTWILHLKEGEVDGTKIEIGRVGNQITFGALDAGGDNWTLMLTYNISMEESDRGAWVPNPKESMQNDDDITDPDLINQLGCDFVKELIVNKRWETGKKSKHTFFVEYAPMDVWGDGIPMNPHWLYASLDLSHCTTCRIAEGEPASQEDGETKKIILQRCGRCGTATYCSSSCQRKDWAVHKNICTMNLEDRGQALQITQKGGLINWDTEKTYAIAGSGEMSKNPNFVVPQLKRSRP